VLLQIERGGKGGPANEKDNAQRVAGRLRAVKATSLLRPIGHIRHRPTAEHVACWSGRGGQPTSH
jgi:hypothetical protein